MDNRTLRRTLRPLLAAGLCLLLLAPAAAQVPYQDIQTVEDPASLTVLVNKNNALPADYVPELEALGEAYGSGSLRPEASQAFRAMADAAREEGISLLSVSAYRSYQHQWNTYNRYLGQYARKTVDTFSARPGHSEHQTGLALDINVASSKAHFEKTPAFAWLKEHCAQYGFLLRYDQGKEEITGYRFEPWHYRYVGVEIAQACMEQGLSYEEYLALPQEPAAEPAPVPEPAPAPKPAPVPEPAPAPKPAPVPEPAPPAMMVPSVPEIPPVPLTEPGGTPIEA